MTSASGVTEDLCAKTVAPRLASSDADLWVFGYGSLIWRPGFDHLEAVRAQLIGLHRAFCVYSVHHRGTAQSPGLVLGLDRSGCCEGVAFRVAAHQAHKVIGYLRAREQVTGVYREERRRISLCDGSGTTVQALCYVVEQAHPQYAGALPLEAEARIIRAARGESGDNFAYLTSTVESLQNLGICDRRLERLRNVAGNSAQQRASQPIRAQASGSTPARHRRLPVFNGEEKGRFLYRRNLARPSLSLAAVPC